MTATVAVFDSLHSGPLHCVELDYFASRLATASSDRTIRLWHVHPQKITDTQQQQQQLLQTSAGSFSSPGNFIDSPFGSGFDSGAGGSSAAAKATLLQELHAHEGPVWQVRWAHPSFGNILASCGYDKRIVVWQQEQPRSGGEFGTASFGLSQEPAAAGGGGSGTLSSPFVPVYSNEDHAASVNALAFAPPEWGLMLAAGSSDGSISILMRSEAESGRRGLVNADARTDSGTQDERGGGGWMRQAVFSAHFNGVYAVAWAPACPLLSQEEENGGDGESGDAVDASSTSNITPMLASGGADCQVRIWGLDRRTNELWMMWQLFIGKRVALLSCEVREAYDVPLQAYKSWIQLDQLEGSSPHTDWVRDVAFQPASAAALLFPTSLLLASCSEDSSVRLWVYDGALERSTTWGSIRSRCANTSGKKKLQWRLLQTLSLDAPVWRIAWSASGTLLAAACGDEDVALFRESVSGVWEKVNKIKGPPSMQMMLPGLQVGGRGYQQQQQAFQQEPPLRQEEQTSKQQGMDYQRLQHGQPGLPSQVLQPPEHAYQQGLQQPGLQSYGIQQQGLQGPVLPQHTLQQPVLPQHTLQQPVLPQHTLQQPRDPLQQFPGVQQMNASRGLQEPRQRFLPVAGPQQPFPMQMPPTHQQEPQALSSTSLRYPRPQGPQQPPQQQAPHPLPPVASYTPPADRPQVVQGVPSAAKELQGTVGSAPSGGPIYPIGGGPYPSPAGVVPGVRPPLVPTAEAQTVKAGTSARGGPPVPSQQSAAGGSPLASGSGTLQPFAVSGAQTHLRGPPLLSTAHPPRQQAFAQQPPSQQHLPGVQQHGLQQQGPQQHQNPPEAMGTGGAAPPLPPSFMCAPLSQSTPGVFPSQSGLPPLGPRQQVRAGANINPFQAYHT